MMAFSVDRRSHVCSPHPLTLEQRAHDLLEQHSHFRGRAGLFEYEHDRDVLIVRGTVPTFYLKQLLQAALKGLEKAVRIDNRVAVACYMGASATELEFVGV